MKVRNIFVLVVLIWGLIGSICLGSPKDDDFGKLVGWIVDPMSEKPVNETFEIEFFDCIAKGPLRAYFIRLQTDEKGYLSIDLRPKQYCIIISPESKTSKYSFEPDESYYPIVIEKGKITEFRKKATIAGALRIKIVDLKGRLINPQIEFPEYSEIITFISSLKNIFPILSTNLSDEDFKDGDIILHTLYPDIYSIKMEFRNTGYKSLKLYNVKIDSGKMSEVEFVVDIDNITGLEGRVVDKNGIPVKEAEVYLSPVVAIDGDFSTYTNHDGYYRLKGLPEGLFTINVIFKTTSYRSGKIKIQNNIMTYKDISLKISAVD